MRYTAVVIDNNLDELTQSVEQLLQCGIFKKVIPFLDVTEAVKYIDNNGCDVLFSEVEMSKIDGFMIGKRYKKYNLAMCFVLLTTHESYALEALQLNVTDFVIKPLELKSIKRIVLKIRDKQYF